MPVPLTSSMPSRPLDPPGDPSHAPEQALPLLATTAPGATQWRAVGAVFLLSLLVLVVAAPFATTPLARVDALVPMYLSARVVIELLTAALLFAQFCSLGMRAVLLLAGGYLFSAAMAILYGLSFPGVFAPAGLFGTASQTTAWLYFAWHGGFSLFLLGYGLIGVERSPASARGSLREVGVTLILVLLLAGGLAAWLATGPALLPELMRGDADTPLKRSVAMASWLITLIALIVVGLRRPRTVLDLWVMLVASIWLVDTALAGLLNQGRFDLGWYTGRLYGLLAAGIVLGLLLVDYGKLYLQSMQHHAALAQRSAAQLQVALGRLSAAQHAAGAGFWEWDVSTGRIDWSEGLYRIYGLDSSVVQPRLAVWRSIVYPDDLAAAEARIAEAVRNRTPLSNRYRIVLPSGEVRWVRARGDMVADETGRIVRMTGLCVDVTDRMAAEEALLESEGKLRLFIEHAPAALAMFDENMRYLAASRRWLADYSLSGPVVGRSHYEVFPDVPERWKAIHRRALAGEILISEDDCFQRMDGTVLWLRWEVRPWHRGNGDVGGVVAMSEDISKRKHAEDALRASEARYRLLMEQAPDGIFVLDANGCYMTVNQAGAAMLGCSPKELVGQSFAATLLREDAASDVQAVWSHAEGAIVTSEWRFQRKDRTVFLGETVVRRLPDGGLQGILRDITERRRAETALRDSEYFYRQTLESIPGMVFTTLPDGHVDFVSQQWVEYSGVPSSEHQGEGWCDLLHPEDRPRALAAWRAAVAGLGTYDLEYRVRRRDGVHEWLKVIGRPIRDARGDIVRWFGLAVNIEQLKQAEEELARRSREVEAILHTMPAMVYVKDAQRQYTRVNPATCEAFGVPAESMLGKRDEQCMPAALARAAHDRDRRVLESRTATKAFEQSWRDGEGRERWLSTSTSPFHNADGSVAGLVGVSVDITEHKHAELRRVEALERQRDVLVREVHHRIKNHLQGVIGLLRYKTTDHPEVVARIELAVAQIGSIAQVYGLQSRSYDTQVRLQELIESAIQSAAGPVSFETEPALPPIVLPQSDAVPMALVINELITNALKHLACAEAPAAVHVRLTKSAAQAVVEIRSAPARLPAGFDYARREGLGTGLELVTVLLPERRSTLSYEQQGDQVVTRLRLMI